MIDKHFTTDNLLIKKLSEDHADFIQELVNSEGWLKYIGDKNIHSREEALAYIQQIINNKAVAYWVVLLKEKHIPIGLISLIKRDYLPSYDLGFAFLPHYSGKGYAFEATYRVLNYVLSEPDFSTLVAITDTDNNKSRALLIKLGFHFKKEIQVVEDRLNLFEITNDSLGMEELYRYYFE